MMMELPTTEVSVASKEERVAACLDAAEGNWSAALLEEALLRQITSRKEAESEEEGQTPLRLRAGWEEVLRARQASAERLALGQGSEEPVCKNRSLSAKIGACLPYRSLI